MSIAIYVVAAIIVLWLGMLSSVVLGGLVFLILAAVLAGLKLAGMILWPWQWVLLPALAAVGGGIGKMWMVTRDPMWRLRR